MSEASRSDHGKQKNKTEPNWDSPKDARSEQGAGKYGKVRTFKTRSGHTIQHDDSPGNESVSIQHRSGSLMQFRPDGAVVVTSHNGQYNLVFGENRVKITGAHDVTVEGGGSLKVDGDYNMTVKGDINMTTHKDFNVTAKNLNQVILGNIDTAAKNQTTKLEGSFNTQAHEGGTIQTGKGLGLSSVEDSVIIGAKKGIGIESKGNDTRMKITGKFSLDASGDVAINSGGNIGIKGTNTVVEGTTKLGLKGKDIVSKATQDNKVLADKKVQLNGNDDVTSNKPLPFPADKVDATGETGSPVTPDAPKDIPITKSDTPIYEAGKNFDVNVG